MKRTESYIETYSNGLPSQTTRYVLFRELITANEWLSFEKWNESVAIKYIRYLETKGLSNSTIKTKAERVARYFDWLIETGRYKKINPINKRIIPKFRDDRPPQALTIDETKKFLKQIPQATWIGCRDKVAVSLMLVHGLRINSVCNIKWSDFEKRNGGLHLNIKSKGNVISNRPIRNDIVDQLKKLHFKTYGYEL